MTLLWAAFQLKQGCQGFSISPQSSCPRHCASPHPPKGTGMLDLPPCCAVSCFHLKGQHSLVLLSLQCAVPHWGFSRVHPAASSVPVLSLACSDPLQAAPHLLPWPGKDKPRSSALPLTLCDRRVQHTMTSEKQGGVWIIFSCGVGILSSLQLTLGSEGPCV